MYSKSVMAVSFVVLLCCTAQAQTVVVDDNIRYRVDPIENSIGFSISKYLNLAPGTDCPLSGCETDASFIYDGQTLTPHILTLDEISDWYLVKPGDTFSVNTIRAGQFPLLLEVTPQINGETVTVGPGEFYLGVRTGVGFTNNRPNRTAYGWVHLRPVDGVLTMVENVMSYNSQGIIVGTTTVVPEPHAVVLVLAMVTLPIVLGRFRLGRSVPESAN